MARLYGVVVIGLQTVAASWQGAVKVSLYERDGMDRTLVELIAWRMQELIACWMADRFW
jgi:hypothetical protein